MISSKRYVERVTSRYYLTELIAEDAARGENRAVERHKALILQLTRLSHRGFLFRIPR